MIKLKACNADVALWFDKDLYNRLKTMAILKMPLKVTGIKPVSIGYTAKKCISRKGLGNLTVEYLGNDTWMFHAIDMNAAGWKLAQDHGADAIGFALGVNK